MKRIAVIGAGAWGTALAMVAHRAGCDVTLWAREPAVAEDICRHHENRMFLPGRSLAPAIRANADLTASVAGADAALVVVPAQHLRAVLERLDAAAALPLVLCAKGIEQGSNALMSEIAQTLRPEAPIAVLSGPSFAEEVAAGLPCAVTLAAADESLAAMLQDALASAHFRIYLSSDLIGVQLGGAVKNVLAIACGIAQGRGLGDSARAALITRGLAEMARLGQALGADARTIRGLSGLGDLVLTCTSLKSRNLSLGQALGGGRTLDAILADRTSVAEGVASAPSVVARAASADIEMPIAAAVDGILHAGADIDDAIGALLGRPLRNETD